MHILSKFSNYKNEHHQCGFCARGVNGYYYCVTCFPDGKPTHALCNPTLGRSCFSKHAAGQTPSHKIAIGIKKAQRGSPRLADRVAQAVQRNAAPPAARPPPAARRRI